MSIKYKGKAISGPPGPGVPPGGTKGQIPAKASDANYDVKWVDPPDTAVGNVYSTEEIEIGKWIDGKPLYRKVYTLSAFTLERDSWSAVLTLDADFQVCMLEMMVKRTDGMVEKYPGRITQIAVENGNIIKAVASGISSPQLPTAGGTIIIEYTKATDRSVV